jgi:hypothetical protein
MFRFLLVFCTLLPVVANADDAQFVMSWGE